MFNFEVVQVDGAVACWVDGNEVCYILSETGYTYAICNVKEIEWSSCTILDNGVQLVHFEQAITGA